MPTQSLERARKAAAFGRDKCEMRCRPRRIIVRAQAQILVDAIGVDQFVGVHFPLRVPDRLEFAERLHQFVAVHQRQEFGLGLAVAVLARQRAAILNHQFGGLAQKTAPFRDACMGLEVERDARVDAAVAEMAVERGLIIEAVDQLLELAQIIAEPQRIDRGVFPADRRIGRCRVERQRGRRGAGFADRPDRSLLRGVGNQPCARRIGFAHVMIEQRLRLRGRCFNRVGAEFRHDPRAAFRQPRDVVEPQAARAQAADDAFVEPLGRNRPERQELRHRIARAIDVGEAEHQQHARRRTLYEFCLRLQRERAGALAADQRARNVETVLRQQLVEVVARHAALDFRKARANQVGVFVAQRLESRIDFAAPAAGAYDLRKLVLAGRADPQAQPVVGQDFERLDVLDCFARHHRVRAARVVAYHAAQRAAAVGGGIGAEGEAMLLGRVAQRIAHHARLDQRRLRARVDRQHPVQVFRGVDDDRDIHALAVLRSAAAAHQDRRAELAADFDRSGNIVHAFRQHHADRRLAVVRGVACVGGATAVVEPDFAAHARREFARERVRVDLGWRPGWRGRGGGGDHAGILTCVVTAGFVMTAGLRWLTHSAYNTKETKPAMSEMNPYQPPAIPGAGVAAGNFIAAGRTVDAGRGWEWIAAGFDLFKKQPGAWILLLIVWMVCFVAISVVPGVGSIASVLLMQIVFGGLMLGCRAVENGERLEVEQLFAGFKQNTGGLALLGLLALAAWVVVILIILIFAVLILGGAGVMAWVGGHGVETVGAAAGVIFLLLALLVMLGLSVPIYMAFWFAPALIVFHNMAPVDALKASFGACMKNLVPFLVYGVVLLALCMVAAIPFLLGYLVLAPVIIASIYTGYRDIFFAG